MGGKKKIFYYKKMNHNTIKTTPRIIIKNIEIYKSTFITLSNKQELKKKNRHIYKFNFEFQKDRPNIVRRRENNKISFWESDTASRIVSAVVAFGCGIYIFALIKISTPILMIVRKAFPVPAFFTTKDALINRLN